MQLSPVQQKFVLHWGEMGTRWGISRTVAQIHALLFLAPEPLTADEITETLGVARSNVSMCLKELRGWGIVRVSHKLGDRRDHFETLSDVWEMFRIILDERKKREIDPTVAVLRECVAAADGEDGPTAERLTAMLGFLESVSGWYDELHGVAPERLDKLVRMRGKAQRVKKALGRTLTPGPSPRGRGE